ncbi:GrpB family protein [Patescibacteria group bacterium]|nr:GrpB family protein [Patescibacteria group bacterium]MBU1895671.1 GrpB family protein [Patescibacteria group bacterium]
MIGLKRGTVKLKLNHKEWEKLFEFEKKYLISKFKDYPIIVEHVGATSIYGVSAKPIIDMMIGMSPNLSIKYVYNKLIELGYEDRGRGGVSGQRLFVKGPEEKRTHYLHITRNNSDYWREHIIFRDYLRKHKIDREAYSNLKKKLAKKFSDNRAEYTKSKGKFINNIIMRATK